VTWKTVGGTAPPRNFGPVTTATLVRYAGASGDFNPMHYDQDYAKAAGYPGVFAQGMYLAALLSTYVAELFAARSVRRFGVTFRSQVWVGAMLTCSCDVIEVRPCDDGVRVVVSLELRADTGSVAVAGEAELHVSDEMWAHEDPNDEPVNPRGVSQ